MKLKSVNDKVENLYRWRVSKQTTDQAGAKVRDRAWRGVGSGKGEVTPFISSIVLDQLGRNVERLHQQH